VFRRDSNLNRTQTGSRSSSAEGGSESDGRSVASDRRSRRSNGRKGRNGGSRAKASFVLYVEGPRDRDILASWARRLDPSLARLVEDETVILGGRQPVRARDDFRKRSKGQSQVRGLIVLDRDHHTKADAAEAEALVANEKGLELFVWGRRHIESYLLVPETLRRVLRVSEGDDRVERVLRDARADAEADFSAGGGEASPVHAKRLLGAGGSLSEAFGVELRAGEIAKAMRADELHDDVRSLFGQIGRLSGVVREGPEIVIRTPRS